jgi:hypothetical protein
MILEIALLSVIKFPAGSPHEFVEALGNGTGKSVLAFYSSTTSHDEFSADLSDLGSFVRIVKTKTGLQQVPGVEHAFSDGMIAKILIKVQPIFNGNRSFATKGTESFEVKDGKVSISKGASSLTVMALMQGPWKTEVGWHWTFDSYNFSASFKELPEKEFLMLLAKAAGMRLDRTKTGFEFKLIPSEFRRRANATITKYATPEKVSKLGQEDKWRLDMTQFALGLANDQQIEKAFGSNDGEAAIFIEGQTKQSLGSKLLKMANEASTLIRNGGDSRGLTSLKPASEGIGGGLEFRGSPASIAGFTETVDWRRPVTLCLRSNFRVRVIGSSLSRDPNYAGPTAPVSVDF